MFESSLMNPQREGGVKVAAAAVSLGFDAAVLASLVLIPLCFTAALPLHPPTPDKSLPRLAPPKPTVIELVPMPHQGTHAVYHDTTFVAPTRIAAHVARYNDLAEEAAPSAPLLPTNGAAEARNNPFGSLFANGSVAPARRVEPAAPPLPKHVKVSAGVSAGYLMRRVQPVYPELARRAHVEGSVILSAVIGADGRIQGLRVVEGSPLLSKAAVEAVAQWLYRPYMLNGQAVEVDTSITLNFRLAGQ